MNCKEKLVVDALLEQLSTAHNWKVSFIRAPFLPRIPTPNWKKGRREAYGREMCCCKLRVEILRNFTFGASVQFFIISQCIEMGTLKNGGF